MATKAKATSKRKSAKSGLEVEQTEVEDTGQVALRRVDKSTALMSDDTSLPIARESMEEGLTDCPDGTTRVDKSTCVETAIIPPEHLPPEELPPPPEADEE